MMTIVNDATVLLAHLFDLKLDPNVLNGTFLGAWNTRK
jgi:hypothetical protein